MSCQKCGAPAAPGVVMCTFCGQAVSGELLASAIPCPQCRTLNAWGGHRCAQCKAWIVVHCVFCGGLSPCNQSACLTCREPFHGAAERRAARDAQMRRHNNLQTFQTVGGVAAPFAGALAGAAIGSYFGSSWGHHHHSYDSSFGGYDSGGGGYAPEPEPVEISDTSDTSNVSGGSDLSSLADSIDVGDSGGGGFFSDD